MREGVEYRKLGDILEILNGYAFKSSEYVKSGIRVIRIANVQKGEIVDDAPAFYPISYIDDLKRYMLLEDDILLSLTGNVGRVGLLQKEMLPAALNQRVACLRVKSQDVLKKYLFHYFNSDLFEQSCINSARGIAQLNMSTEWLKEQSLPIPSIAEQQIVISELDRLTTIIADKRQQLKELDNLAQAIFYDMFGDPVKNEKSWVTEIMGNIAPSKKNSSDVVSVDGRYWLLNLDMIEGGTGAVIDKVLLTKEEMGSSITSFSEENVLYSKLRPYLNKVIFPKESGYCTSELVPLLPVKSKLDGMFLTYLLRSKTFVEYISGKVAGAKMPRVVMSDFWNFKVILPPLSLQSSFATKVQLIENQKADIAKSIQEFENLLAQRMEYHFA